MLALACAVATVAFGGSILVFEVQVALDRDSIGTDPILELDAARLYGFAERGGALLAAFALGVVFGANLGEGKPAVIESSALRNSSLQGGYLILAARALGLDCGPMSGFDAAKLDAAFWAGTAVRTNFVCALGTGDPSRVMPRSPRLAFDDACRLT